MDAATLNIHLEKHLRVATFPLGIRPLRPGEPAHELEDCLARLFVLVEDPIDLLGDGHLYIEPVGKLEGSDGGGNSLGYACHGG